MAAEQDDDRMGFIVKNQYHDSAWKTVRKHYLSWSEFRKRMGLGNYGSFGTKFSQKKLLEQNQQRIEEIVKNELISEEKSFQILKAKNWTLVKSRTIPNVIIESIILFVGNGSIPISYSLDYLPFFRATREHKLYTDTLQKWWDEIRKSPNHRGLFYPKDINNAAKEFQQFFTKRLAENGINRATLDRVKYHECMIPQFEVNIAELLENEKCKDLVSPKLLKESSKRKTVKFDLPTASGSSACIGGIELMQRLYLETAVQSNVFEIELVNIGQSHGDNWCFDGYGTVLMEFGQSKLIKDLQVGDRVCSFPGNRISKIECVIVSNIFAEIEMVKLKNECWITFEHPILVNCDDDNDMNKYAELKALHSADISRYNLKWALPKNEFDVVHRFQDKIYNFVLSDHHTINVNGNWCCTLGHNLKGQVIEHEFWGNSTRIHQFLKRNCPTYPFCVFDKRVL